ncbi:hypothetical protein [Defluviimonas sp. SAOS-178_SWC]|uniref:hypothetical protein n=1 Tax=Defluviimonas sp. SAOS-178_SWC TaxID=3121287 RepID=UPI0032218A04
MDADDVGMLQFRQGARFLFKKLEDLAEFLLPALRAKPHGLPRTAADRSGETLLDDDFPAEAVARKVGDPESAGIQIGVDRVLPAAQFRSRRQLVPEDIGLIDNVFVRRLVQFCSLDAW